MHPAQVSVIARGRANSGSSHLHGQPGRQLLGWAGLLQHAPPCLLQHTASPAARPRAAHCAAPAGTAPAPQAGPPGQGPRQPAWPPWPCEASAAPSCPPRWACAQAPWPWCAAWGQTSHPGQPAPWQRPPCRRPAPRPPAGSPGRWGAPAACPGCPEGRLPPPAWPGRGPPAAVHLRPGQHGLRPVCWPAERGGLGEALLHAAAAACRCERGSRVARRLCQGKRR